MALTFTSAQDLREKLTVTVYVKTGLDQAKAEMFDELICIALNLDDDAGFPPFLHEAKAQLG
jgi:hypothetical protein